jgi:hypothetical protein
MRNYDGADIQFCRPVCKIANTGVGNDRLRPKARAL